MTRKYRERIYRSYVSARHKSLAPATDAGLEPRGHLLRHLIRQHFPVNRDAAILDLGCGHGAFLYFARQCGYRNLFGVDASPEQIEAAQRLGIERCQVGDSMETLATLGPETQDVVISFDVIEHFTKDEVISLIDQVYRVLRGGGRWIIHTPNGESPFAGRMLFWDFTHEMAYTRTSIAQLLRSSGFTKVRSFEDKPIVHGLKSAIRRILWEASRLFLRLFLAAETGDTAKDAIFSQNFSTVAEK